MSKTLAELRAEAAPAFLEHSILVCLAPQIAADIEMLSRELSTLEPEPTPVADDEPSTPKRNAGPLEPPRATEIRAELATLLDRMAEYEGELRLRAIDDGAWRLWADAHPVRDKDEPGHQRDEQVTGGWCNSDALIADLAEFAHSWNGEVLAEGDWITIAAKMSGPDKKLAAQAVVGMQEDRQDFPQWRAALSASLSRYDASVSRVNSESAPGGSTAGSPDESSADSTPTATA